MISVDALSVIVQLQRPDGSWIDVGRLSHANETSWFESFGSYWDSRDRPVLGQVFEEHGPGYRPSARVALPTWFSHLLPEGFLRQVVAEAANVKPEREYFLLDRIGGDDLPGAVRVVPEEATTHDVPPETNVSPSVDDDGGPLKFSLDGVQVKFSVVPSAERGLTVPTTGQAGTWIAKLPDRRAGYDHVPEAEFAGLELARAAGINVPDAHLSPVAEIQRLPDWALRGGGQALIIRRFDRGEGGKRVHVEELAQVLDVPTGSWRFKYRAANFETVCRFVFALCCEDALGQVIDRVVLNVLLGNGDAHTKNWAFVYPDGRTPVLSPAYDIVPTVLYDAADDLGLNLAGSKQFSDVRLRAFQRLAQKAGWDGALGVARAREAVGRIIDAWHVLPGLLPATAVDRLTTRRDSLPLTREA